MKKTILSASLLLFTFINTQAQVKINEIMASNDNTISDNNGEYDDWIEIYNAGDVSVNFGGMYVTDDPEEITKWQIPTNQSNSTTIAPGQYMIIWFDKDPEQGPLHVDTKLSANGEYVILTDIDGESRIDSVSFGEQSTDISWGRIPDATGDFAFLNPTPAATNAGSELPEQTEAPVFTLESGYYSGNQAIGLSSATTNAEIRFTLDGSVPTSGSTLYSGPIALNSSTVVRAIAIAQGQATSEISTNTYLFDETSMLPVVSFVMEPDSLFDYDKGMYVIGDSSEASEEYPFFGANYWEEWEYPMHLEYIANTGGVEFEFSAGASIGGNFSRAFNKKSFIINNNDEYGIDELQYELFPENDYNEYDGFVLRAGAEERSRLLNELMYTINKDWNHKNAMQAHEAVILYINGQYWGIYNLMERKNDDFVESRYGYDDVDMIKDYNKVKDGDYTDYQELLDTFRNEALDEEEFFTYAKANIDFDSFTDHWVYQLFTSHGDPNNLRYWRPREEGGKWHYISHDFDWWRNLGDEPSEYTPVFTNYLKQDIGGFWLLGRMLQNPTYREIFLNRLADMFNTAFQPGYLMAVIDSIDTSIDPEMPRDIARWTDGWYDNGGFTNYDMEYIRDITEDYIVEYPPFLYAEIKDTLQVDTVRVTLAQTQNGGVHLNSISPNTDSNHWSGLYFSNTSITLEAKPDLGYEVDTWLVNGSSAGNGANLVLELQEGQPMDIEATFKEITNNQIVVNEINYNSAEAQEAGDWIELYNYADTPIDISGWVYRDENNSNKFVIPEGSAIAAEGYVVIASDTAAFKTIHSGVTYIKGQPGFGLGGNNDEVRIYTNSGGMVDSVRYDDESPWPIAADGDGFTLELQNSVLDNALAENWNASTKNNGTPGAQNSTYVVTSNEDEADTPNRFTLNQNYPNPFNPTTNISFNISKTASVELTVYTILGQKVQTLINRRLSAGSHSYTFDASELTSGVYIYRLNSGKQSITKKMLLIK